MSLNRRTWGEEDDEEDDEDDSMPLPPPEISGPDEKGIKTEITYSKDAKNRKVKTIRQYKVIKKKHRVSKRVAERAKWPKFGHPLEAASDDKMTFRSQEEVKIEKPGEDVEIEKRKQAEQLTQIAAKHRARVEQRMLEDAGLKQPDSMSGMSGLGASGGAGAGGGAGGDAGATDGVGASSGRSKGGLYDPSTAAAMRASGGSLSTSGPGGSGGGGYVPPHMRDGGGGGSKFADRDETNTLRVSNVSEDTTEADLKELFRPFGHVTRLYLAKDRETQQNRGFAYVTYSVRTDAEQAKKALDGHGYDHLILRVDWAQSNNKKESAGSENLLQNRSIMSGYGKALPQGTGR